MALVTDQKYFADFPVCTQMLGCLFLSAANGLYLLYFSGYDMAALPQLIQICKYTKSKQGLLLWCTLCTGFVRPANGKVKQYHIR